MDNPIKYCGPWIIEPIGHVGESSTTMAEQYVVYSVPEHRVLAKYYFAALNNDKTGNIYLSFADFDLRKLAKEMGHMEAAGLSGSFVKTQTDARRIIEYVLKHAGYKIANPKFAALT